MRTLIIASWLYLAAPICSFAGDTNEFTLFTFQSGGKTNASRISESRVRATPEWIPGKSIPLSPDKAWLIAQKWSLQHGFADPDLIDMRIRPIWSFSLKRGVPVKDASHRFYYCINFDSPRGTSAIPVIILFDGSVVESVSL